MKGRIYLFAALIALAAAARLMLPEASLELRNYVSELLVNGADYTGAVETLGRQLAAGGLGREFIAALMQSGEESGAEDKPAQEQRAQAAAVVKTDVTEVAAAPESEQPEAVKAFLEAQAEFDGFELPENVRSDMPELPFEHVSPVEGHKSSGFGYRVHPIDDQVKFHYGTDFAADSGDAVRAFAKGYVSASGCGEGYGNYLIVTHEGGFSTLYAHLSEIEVSEGEAVECGQTIGLVGQTGKATGPHLHFELLLGESYLNPEYYL